MSVLLVWNVKAHFSCQRWTGSNMNMNLLWSRFYAEDVVTQLCVQEECERDGVCGVELHQMWGDSRCLLRALRICCVCGDLKMWEPILRDLILVCVCCGFPFFSVKNKGLAVFWFSRLWGGGYGRCSFVLPLCPIDSYSDLSRSRSLPRSLSLSLSLSVMIKKCIRIFIFLVIIIVSIYKNNNNYNNNNYILLQKIIKYITITNIIIEQLNNLCYN